MTVDRMNLQTPGITKIGQIALTVKDLEAATAFYRDTLGLPFLFVAPGMAFFRVGDQRLMLGQPENNELPFGNSILYYQVPDIQAAHALLLERGVEFVAAPHLVASLPDHDLWIGFLKDPEANLVALMSEVRPVTTQNHEVRRLWIRRHPGGPMESQDTLTLETGKGVVGDYVYGRMRHVTIVFEDDWNAAAATLGREVDPAGRRGNVLVSGGHGIRFTPGTLVRLGKARLEIRGITLPCENMENAAPGMRHALEPEGRGGVWGVVRQGGVVRVGDALQRETVRPEDDPAR